MTATAHNPATIGITLNVKDLANSADLWSGLEADQVPMWCAAWGAAPDPDLYQIYYSIGDKAKSDEMEKLVGTK